MLGALAIKVNLEGEDLQSKRLFDLALTLLQVVPAAITLLVNMYDAKTATKEALQERNIRNQQHETSEGDASLEKRIDEEEGNLGKQGLDTFNPVNSQSRNIFDATASTHEENTFSLYNPMPNSKSVKKRNASGAML